MVTHTTFFLTSSLFSFYTKSYTIITKFSTIIALILYEEVVLIKKLPLKINKILKRRQNMKRIYILIFLFICSILYADPVLLVFVDGTIEYKQGNSWTEIYIGEYIPDNTDIRIYDDTYAEIKAGSVKVTISTEGIYSINSLFKSSESLAAWDFSTLIGDKIAKLTGFGEEELGYTEMGVRGDLLFVTDTEWMDDDEKSLNDAKKLIAEQEYMTALEILLDAVPFAYGSILDEMNFFTGYLYNELNNHSLSLKYLDLVPHNKYVAYFPELVLLKGSLLMERLSFDAAIELLNIYIENYPNGSKIQPVYYLSAICLNEQGNINLSKANLEKAVAIDPYSDIGKTAASKLDNM